MITLKSLSDSLVNKTETNKLSFVSLARTQMFEPKICYKTYLNFSLQKRKRLLDIIRSDDSWTRKNDGIHYTNLYAHHTEWFLHEEYEEFKELTNMIETYLANSILQVPFKYETKECWGGIYSKDDYAKKHHHSPYLWAWTYYPFAPEGSAPLRFHDPIVNTLKDIDDSFVYEVQPKDDLLVLFSGNRYHSVPKSKTNSERVVVAGNIYLSGDTKY